jgi:succinoglycan biosynthesis transport protein ExoP
MASKSMTSIPWDRAEKKHSQGSLNDEINRPGPLHAKILEAHLSDYLEILIRRRWIVIACFIAIVGITTVVSFKITPQYEATAQIILGEQPTLMNPMGDGPEKMSNKNLLYKTQVNLLTSRTLVRRVIDELGLENVLAQDSDSEALKPLAQANGPEASNEAQKMATSIEKTGNALRAQVVNWYLRHLTVTPVEDSSLVDISFRGPDAVLTKSIVNKHAEAAIENTVHQHQSQAKDALDWLKAQIEAQKKEVRLSQRAIYDFKKKNNVLSLEDSQIIFSQEMQELNSALTSAKSERLKKQAIYLQLNDFLRDHKDVMLIPEISNYPIIQNLRNQLTDLKSMQIKMGTKYGPKHPKMMELKNGITQLKNEILKESKRLQKTIKADLERAGAIEKSIEISLNKQKQIAMSLGERAIEYDVLKQQAESSQDIYDFLLKQSEELGLASAISSSNMRIVDKAEVPGMPVSPNIRFNILIATFFSLFAGAALAFFVEYLDNTVKEPIDVAIHLGLPVLGMIPFQKILQEENHKLLESETTKNSPADTDIVNKSLYRISHRLPEELRRPADGLFGRVLMVESVTMAEGKSTVVSRIAENLAIAGMRVLMVDCDFKRQSLDKIFKVSNGGGLGESIYRIMSHHLESGTLNNYSVDDLFFLIAMKKMSGRLMVKNEDQLFRVTFQHGALLHIQCENSPENNRIGAMLLKGGFITKDQLDDALERNKRTGQPIGYILVNSGYINRDNLRGPLRLQMEEYIQKIYSWKNGFFAFKPEVMPIYENEKIFYEEDYGPLINNLGRIESSKFIDKELFSHIVVIKRKHLYLLPAGGSYKFMGLMNQNLMRKILEKLKLHFDVILIDTPPLDTASGIESLFPLIDGMVLVIKAGHLSVKILDSAIGNLPQDKIIGTILNQTKHEFQLYYY